MSLFGYFTATSEGTQEDDFGLTYELRRRCEVHEQDTVK